MRDYPSRLKPIDMGLLVIVGGLLLYALLLLNKDLPHADESFHISQIDRFEHGKWTLNPGVTMIPFYHLIVAGIVVVLHHDSVSMLRLIAFAFSAASLFIFFLCSKEIDESSAVLRTLEWSLLPILFPFFFLVYTDLPALLFMLTSLLFFLRRQMFTSGLVGNLSWTIRQQQIVWYVFFPLLRLTDLRSHKETLREMWVFLLGSAAFIVFVIYNHGIAIGDASFHPFPYFSLGNPYFFLFVFFILFLPLHLLALQRLWSVLTAKRTVLLLLGLAGLFVLYWFTFTNSHPYNQADYVWWLRNKVLVFAVRGRMHKVLFFVPVAGGLLSLLSLPLLRKSYALIYPLTFLYLAPSWLIEQRYYLAPLTLFLLFRRPHHRWIEYTLIAYWFVLSAVFLSGIHSRRYFL